MTSGFFKSHNVLEFVNKFSETEPNSDPEQKLEPGAYTTWLRNTG